MFWKLKAKLPEVILIISGNRFKLQPFIKLRRLKHLPE